MTDVKPVMFLYLSGAIDILITTICIFMRWGKETTTLYNWIAPTWLMCLTMVAANTVFCLFSMVAYVILHKQEHPAIKATHAGFSVLLYGLGLARLMFGAGSGMMVIMAVMMR